jgi:hypothetical protein
MRTKKFKTQRGWLDFLAKRGTHGSHCIYEPLNEFFKDERHFWYHTKFREPGEKYHSELVRVPFEWKYEFALAVVNFHWRRRTKSEREWIAVKLAKGEGDLSMLQSFQLELRKTDGEWVYDYCTSGLSGPNYDWCKRKYLQSL